MPLKEMPSFGPKEFRMLEIPQPGIGGLNLKDLEFEQDVNQSPWMMNMMYRNGAFSKRYGQGLFGSYEDEIYAAEVYRGDVYVHAGTKIYNGITVVASGLPERKGLFVLYNQNLYYFCDRIYSYDGTTWGEIEPYVPIVVINRTPDATSGDTMEPYNMVGTGFQNIFHGDGTSTVYQLTDTELDEITPKVLVDNEEWTYDEELSGNKTFKVDYATGQVTMNPAPLTGTNNVEITAYKHDDEWNDYHDQILSSKYYSCFGGNNNSRLFLAGGGKSTYYYSEVYDASYFPYINYARVGNSADDITGFGQQYNVLLIFKPTEIFSLSYYQQSSSTTTDESQYGLGAFASQMVNARMGCDCPHSIQLINNQLTWFSSKVGVCTLLSTNIQDERNVRVISRNIERSNGFGITGILDINEDPEKIQSADFDSKYFLCFPSDGYCFVWDYAISPYFASKDPKNLTWFLFDRFYVKQFVKKGDRLIYICDYYSSKSWTFTNLVQGGNFADLTPWDRRGLTQYPYFDPEDPEDPIMGYYGQLASRDGGGVAYARQTISVTRGHKYYLSYSASTQEEATMQTPLGFLGLGTETTRFTGIVTAESDSFTLSFWLSNNGAQGTISVALGLIKNVMMFDVTNVDLSKGQLDEYIDHYISNETITKVVDLRNDMALLNSSFSDLDFNGDGEHDAIHAYYMTPFMQFGAVEWLKNVKNMYVQCRGDTNTRINIQYYTDVDAHPEEEPEPIEVNGRGFLWKNFHWDTFKWYMNIWGNVFRRRCNLKHIQMCAVFFENSEADNDLSMAHIGLQYQTIRNIK